MCFIKYKVGLVMLINSQNTQYSPNFGAMKKSQFKGLDLLCVNTFKAPIEKFNENADLQNWAKNKLVTDVFSKNLEGRTPRCTIERNSVMQKWKDFFENKKTISASAFLLIASALFGKLSPKTDDVPPPLDEKILDKTLKSVNDNSSLNLQKVYINNLRNEIIGCDVEKLNGWVVIPSYDNDTENFDKNVKKLELLSSPSWCTKFSKAESHLQQGDFHIYYENGKPQLGVQLNYYGEVEEVQGAHNDDVISIEHIKIFDQYVKQNKLELTDRAYDGYFTAKKRAETAEKAKIDLVEDIQSKNYTNILKYFGIERQENEHGTVTLNKYNDYYDYKSMGIDVQDMLKDVVKIKGDADFRKCSATDLSKLQEIGGFADFTDANVKNLSNLKSIGKFAIFKNSNVANLNSLESCPKLDVSYSNITELPNFKEGKITSNIEVKTPLIK